MFACQGNYLLTSSKISINLIYFLPGKPSASLLAMSFLIHLSLSNIIMLSPLFLLLISDPFSHLASPRALTTNLRNLIPLAVEFVVYSLILTLVSTVVAGSWAWIPQTWGATYVFRILLCHSYFELIFHSLSLPDLTPNTGLWWYFFTEMFDHFRPFFLMVFNVWQSPFDLNQRTDFVHPLDSFDNLRGADLCKIPVSLSYFTPNHVKTKRQNFSDTTLSMPSLSFSVFLALLKHIQPSRIPDFSWAWSPFSQKRIHVRIWFSFTFKHHSLPTQIYQT